MHPTGGSLRPFQAFSPPPPVTPAVGRCVRNPVRKKNEMNQDLTDDEIKKVLEHLTYSSQTDVMAQKLFFSETETIRHKGMRDDRIIDALRNIASNAPSASARKEASKTLTYLGTETRAPTIGRTVGVGTVTGVLAWVIVFSIVEHPPTSLQYLSEMFTASALPYFFFVLLACIVGAYIGRSNGRSPRAVWTGAIMGLVVSAILMVIRIVVFCCQ